MLKWENSSIKTDTMGSEIALNRKARHDYTLEDQVEAGLVLQGWEVKSLRQGRAQISDAFVTFRNGEAYLFNAHITPLETASTHITTEPTRSRKLLMHAKELHRLLGKNKEKGYTLIPLKLYWKNNKAKVLVALGKGKKEYDKRADEKERSWKRQKDQILKRHSL